MRIAGPILAVMTPIGVLFGLREAWVLAGPAMAVLMGLLITVVGGFFWMTVQRIRREHQAAGGAAAPAPASSVSRQRRRPGPSDFNE